MPFAVFHVNAFTAQRFAGNPAAVCLLNGWLDDARLRGVAAENNLSETAFLMPRDAIPRAPKCSTRNQSETLQRLVDQSLAAQEFAHDFFHIAVLTVDGIV
jgi:hypothetical protein